MKPKQEQKVFAKILLLQEIQSMTLVDRDTSQSEPATTHDQVYKALVNEDDKMLKIQFTNGRYYFIFKFSGNGFHIARGMFENDLWPEVFADEYYLTSAIIRAIQCSGEHAWYECLPIVYQPEGKKSWRVYIPDWPVVYYNMEMSKVLVRPFGCPYDYYDTVEEARENARHYLMDWVYNLDTEGNHDYKDDAKFPTREDALAYANEMQKLMEAEQILA